MLSTDSNAFSMDLLRSETGSELLDVAQDSLLFSIRFVYDNLVSVSYKDFRFIRKSVCIGFNCKNSICDIWIGFLQAICPLLNCTNTFDRCILPHLINFKRGHTPDTSPKIISFIHCPYYIRSGSLRQLYESIVRNNACQKIPQNMLSV